MNLPFPRRGRLHRWLWLNVPNARISQRAYESLLTRDDVQLGQSVGSALTGGWWPPPLGDRLMHHSPGRAL
jgi:hypothetical protein